MHAFPRILYLFAVSQLAMPAAFAARVRRVPLETLVQRSQSIYLVEVGTGAQGAYAAPSKRQAVERALVRQALLRARKTNEIKALLTHYGHCKGCRAGYAKGVPNIIGCVQYEVVRRKLGNRDSWAVSFWVSRVCSFRHGTSPRVTIALDRKTGAVVSKSPDLSAIRKPKHCRRDADCVCLSGSGRRFAGCRNTFHGPAWFAGSYRCNRCRCHKNICQ
jgi:hypothetical protein